MRDGRITEAFEQGVTIGVEVKAFRGAKTGGDLAVHHRVDHGGEGRDLHRAGHCLVTEGEAEIGER